MHVATATRAFTRETEIPGGGQGGTAESSHPAVVQKDNRKELTFATTKEVDERTYMNDPHTVAPIATVAHRCDDDPGHLHMVTDRLTVMHRTDRSTPLI